jgi:hypothetical protein
MDIPERRSTRWAGPEAGRLHTGVYVIPLVVPMRGSPARRIAATRAFKSLEHSFAHVVAQAGVA